MSSFTPTSLSSFPTSGFGNSTTTTTTAATQMPPLLEAASDTTTPLEAISLPPKAVLSVLDNRILLLYDTTVTPAAAVLTLRTGKKSYVKFRAIGAAPLLPSSSDAWISVGKPALLYLRLADLQREVNVHCQNPKKFGSPKEIRQAYYDEFLKNLEVPVRVVASQQVPSEYKLTTEMDPSGQLRVAEKTGIGNGGSKLVYDDRDMKTGQHIARAKLKKNLKIPAASIAEFLYEAKISSTLAQGGVPNLVYTSLTHGQDLGKARLEMPLQNRGNLLQIAESGAASTPEESRERLLYTLCIAETLKEMHAQGYTHNDVKLENCYICVGTGKAVMGDLGSVREINAPAICGTFPAPEYSSHLGDPVSANATTQNDRWAFGFLLYEILYGYSPYPLGYDQGHDVIIENSRKLVAGLNGSENVVDWCICNLLSLDPHTRPEMAHVHTCLLAATMV